MFPTTSTSVSHDPAAAFDSIVRELRREMDVLREAVAVLQETIRASTRLAASLWRTVQEKNVRIRELENTVKLLESLVERRGGSAARNTVQPLRAVARRGAAPPSGSRGLR